MTIIKNDEILTHVFEIPEDKIINSKTFESF